jgi:hypothetical protein
MPNEILIHASPNGDCWFLLRKDADPERLRVRHQPNRASGGQASLIEIEQFLIRRPRSATRDLEPGALPQLLRRCTPASCEIPSRGDTSLSARRYVRLKVER